MTNQEIIDIVKAAMEGKTIQCRRKRATEWFSAIPDHWNFDAHDYRVKPEPREFWISVNKGFIMHRAHSTLEAARANLDCDSSEIIHVREVL